MPAASAPKEELAYKSTLKKTYGLTDSMIARLGPPYKIVPNPHYRSKTSSLYNRERLDRERGIKVTTDGLF